jgi:glutamate-ammonia-ligase adenylyltransferase
MRSVRAIFQRIITQTPAETKAIDLSMFRDAKRATKALADLASGLASGHLAPRTRQVFRKLRPLLLSWLEKVADPDATLTQFVRFVEAYGLRSMLFELLVSNPKLLELLVTTLDVSRFAGDLLARRPQLLEDITRRDEKFYQSRTVAEHLRRLDSLGASTANLDPVRAYRQRQLLRIILRDVLRITNTPAIFGELSDLAEACLLFVSNLIGSNNLTIVALGKFGGREINYGADLDVLFVGDNVRAAQRLIAATAQPSSEGSIVTLDARLRPDGEKGPLVCSLAACETYYQQRAQLWEVQALTRARPLCGALQRPFIEIVQRIWHAVGQRSELFPKIDNMLERIRRERGSRNDFLDFKTGGGGMIEAEFLVHALQMKSGLWSQNWNAALSALGEADVLSSTEVESAIHCYNFLRGCETALRRWENKSVPTLPAESNEQQKLGHRLGFKNIEEFAKEYCDARATIHSLYQRHIQTAAR